MLRLDVDVRLLFRKLTSIQAFQDYYTNSAYSSAPGQNFYCY